MDGKALVRAGYNAMGDAYLRRRDRDGEDMARLRAFAALLPDGARVLDAGCGPGVPVAQFLSQRFDVTGVDFAATQLRLARAHVPAARFACQDLTALAFPDGAFDAIVSCFAIIHVPREAHPALLRGFRRVLRPGGYALLSVGRTAWVGAEDDFCGVRMWWSHYAVETYRRLLPPAGFEVIWSRLAADSLDPDAGAHPFVLARRR